MLIWYNANAPGRFSEIAPLLLAAVLASYLFFDGLFVFLSGIQLGLYVAFAVAAVTLAATSAARISIRQQELNLILAWLLVASVYLLPVMASDYQYPRYILTDLITVLVPLALFIVGLRFPEFFLSRRMIALIVIVAFIAAVLAVPAGEAVTRHEPPPTILIAAAWSVFYLAPGPITKRLAGVGLAVLLLLAWTSGERTSVLLWLGLGLVGRYFLIMRLRNLLLAVVFLMVAGTMAIVTYGESLLLAAAETRFESLAQGELDDSLLNRLLEVRDTWSQWSLAQWYGFGHGATYLPEVSYLARNFTEHGRVHNIHFGPMLLLFRYGLPGLLLYIWLLADILRFALRQKRVRFAHPDGFLCLFFSLALIGYLVAFLAFNVIPDPAFSYVLAGYLFLRLTHPASCWTRVQRVERQ